MQLRQKLARAGEVLTVGALQLDTAAHSVNAGGTPVHLTKTEYAILKLLMQHPGQGAGKIHDPRTHQSGHARLHRSKPEAARFQPAQKLRDASGSDPIEAVWGIGFRLADES